MWQAYCVLFSVLQYAVTARELKSVPSDGVNSFKSSNGNKLE